MFRLLFLALLFALLAVPACRNGVKSEMRVTSLRCEYLTQPVGLGERQPRFSWTLESGRRGERQTAYRVIVASSAEILSRDRGDLWDSGQVLSARTSQVVYGGQPLRSGQECFWKVCAWDVEGRETGFSAPARWSTGLLEDTDWSGEWIGRRTGVADTAGRGVDREFPPGPSPVLLRTAFNLDKPVRRATAHASARGIFDLHLNGMRVSGDLFSPEWTDYTKRIQYRSWDVTDRLIRGKNAVGAVLADGWYSGYLGWEGSRCHYGDQNSFILQLVVEYTDGTRDEIVSDGTWRVTTGPWLDADFQMGETYDARLEIPGWDSAAFDDSSWSDAETFEKPEAPLVALPAQPVRVTEEICPAALFRNSTGAWIFDLGENISGFVRLKVSGKPGDKVVLRFAERLNPDSTIYVTNLRKARATDTYILKGGGDEVWEPRFTFHGFQYVELVGFPGEPGPDALTGLVVQSDTPPVGSFVSSLPLVNRLVSNIERSQRGNFLSVPTDCPQRDERLGWMGDAQIFIRTAAYNMDVAAFFTKWMQDVEDAQSGEGAYSEISPRFPTLSERSAAAGWGDAGVIIPWTMFLVYGDTRIIERHWDSMTRWMDYIRRDNPDFVRRNGRGSDYGDWLSIGADTPKELLATAYWAFDADLMSRMASAVGRDDEAIGYRELFEAVRGAFQREYVSADARVKGETQTGYLLALYFDLLPEELRAGAAELLVENIRDKDWHLSTGFLGVRQLNPVLTSEGYPEVAWRLLETETFPSWFYPILNGATSIWERWDGWTREKGFQTPSMNSFNHYSLGSVGEWLYSVVGGIDLDEDEPGFRRLIVRPRPGGSMTWARAGYESINGMIKSEWSLDGDSLSLSLAVPANVTAKVYLPCAEGTVVQEGSTEAFAAEGVLVLPREDGCSVFEVGSGQYEFRFRHDL